jgi:hypothetical protein
VGISQAKVCVQAAKDTVAHVGRRLDWSAEDIIEAIDNSIEADIAAEEADIVRLEALIAQLGALRGH